MIEGLSDEANAYYLNNPVPFVQDFIKLNGKAVNPYEYQQPVLNTLPLMEPHLDNQVRLMAVLGARQIFGKSTTASFIATWYAYLHDNAQISIISHRQRRSDKMLAKIKKYISSNSILDGMSKTYNSDLTWSTSEIELSNNTIITSLPEGNDADSSVGDTTNVAIIDEVARFKNCDSIKASILPTLFESFGVVIMFSSSWGRGGKGEYWFTVVNNPEYTIFKTDSMEALKVQYRRWVIEYDKKKAETLIQKKLDWLKFQKRELGEYLYNMQYMNSFEHGLDSAFEQADLDVCFTDIPQLFEPMDDRKYICIVDFGKSVKTGDKTVISVYDYTDIEKISCIYRQGYSLLYTKVLPKIVDAVCRFNVDSIYCDLGGGEKQVEDLNEDVELLRRGIKTIGVFFSGTMRKTTTDYEDKGIIRKTINKYQCANRLVSYVENHNIKYCRDCNRNEYDNYLIVETPSGLRTYNHPPNGHDDAIDTDIILMSVISEMTAQIDVYGAHVVKGSSMGGISQSKENSIMTF